MFGKKEKDKKSFLFGMFYQFSLNIVVALNIPLLLYVHEVMKKGPVVYGVIDALIGISALFTGLFWTKYYRYGQKRLIFILMPICAGMLLCLIAFSNYYKIIPYILFAVLSIFLTSSKVQCRAAVLEQTPADIMGKVTAVYQAGNYILLLVIIYFLSYLCKLIQVKHTFLILGLLMLAFSLFVKWVYREKTFQKVF